MTETSKPDRRDWPAIHGWWRELSAIDPRRGVEATAAEFTVMADRAEALGNLDQARRLRCDSAVLPMRIILRWREPEESSKKPDERGRVHPMGLVGTTVHGYVECSFGMGWWPDKVRVWRTLTNWKIEGPAWAASNASPGDSVWDPFDPRCPVRVALGAMASESRKFDHRNAPFELTGPLRAAFPFDAEPGPSDQDSVAEVVDDCETIEQAELLTRVMTRHRDDADTLVARVIARWSDIDILAEELAS